MVSVRARVRAVAAAAGAFCGETRFSESFQKNLYRWRISRRALAF